MALLIILLSTLLLNVVVISDDSIGENIPVNSPVKEFLHIAQAEGIISASQLLKLQRLADKIGLQLQLDDVPEKDTATASPGIFMKLYNRLTLLNVLYFGGALLVMGAATLFMTLAWERFSGINLFFIITAMSTCAGTIGVMFWKMEEYEMAGGL